MKRGLRMDVYLDTRRGKFDCSCSDMIVKQAFRADSAYGRRMG